MSYTVFNDEVFKGLGGFGPQPFTKREAYLWICSESRNDTVKHSLGFMAQAFGWYTKKGPEDRKKVSRFLDELVDIGALVKMPQECHSDATTYLLCIQRLSVTPEAADATRMPPTKTRNKNNNNYCAEFERWWKLWLDKGRAVSKVKAYKEWNKVNPALRESCYNAAYQYLKGCTNPKYIMHPDRFLRNNDFEDQQKQKGLSYG